MVIDQVQAVVVYREYEPAWTETKVITDTNGKGVAIGTHIETTNHPEEWTVRWQYQELAYTQETGYNYDGILVGDKKQMNIRQGGVFKNQYLWPN